MLGSSAACGLDDYDVVMETKVTPGFGSEAVQIEIIPNNQRTATALSSPPAASVTK
jgi:hypothetical protein